MQIGEYTAPVRFSNGHWYIFKLTRKQLQTENLTLETKNPNVRQQITDGLMNQRKQILNAALLEVAMNESKIINNLAANMLNNPSNLGLRPAAPGGAATPAAATSTPQATTPASTPAAAVASPKASASAKP
jgi:hypothetical protein